MKTHAFRLTKGQDLKQRIVDYCKQNHIQAGYVACLVGCVDELNIRLAGGTTFFHDQNDYEIVSVTGTLSKDGVHIHASFSDIHGKTIGGHLSDGCIVNTTAEVILCEIEDSIFSREFDETTGYKEIIMSK